MSTAVSTVLSNAAPQGVPLPYLQRFSTNGFIHDPVRSPEDEFKRLASHMSWAPGSSAYIKQHKEARRGQGTSTEGGVEATGSVAATPTHRNHVASYAEHFSNKKGYKPDSTLAFSDEFARLATSMKWLPESKAYVKHCELAMIHEVDIQKPDYASLPIFKQSIIKGAFCPKPGLPFNEQFSRLAQHMQWNPSSEEYNKSRCRALAEATRTPFIKAHTKSALMSAPSTQQGVPLNARSGPPSTQLTLTHRPAPSTQQGVPLSPEPAPPPSVSAFSSYFSNFAARGFTINPNVSFQDEFARLASHMNWQPGTKSRVEHWRNALESEFGDQYGDSSHLSGWQALCTELGVENPPESITKCKKVRSYPPLSSSESSKLTLTLGASEDPC